jgi:nucleotide-binding universal stress UspA family protein
MIGADLQVLRIIEAGEFAREPGESDEAALVRTKARFTDELTAEIRRHGIDGRICIEQPLPDEAPAEALIRLSKEAYLISMHSRGRRGLARLLHGSVALHVLRESQIPIMLGGPELHPPLSQGERYRLLVTTDLSPASRGILLAIAPLLQVGNFNVTLLHVHEHAPSESDNDAKVREHEASLAEMRGLLPDSVPVEITVRQIARGGGIDTAILESARDLNAQAIAMSTRGHTQRRDLLIGSVALSVLTRSTVPLIVTSS